MPDHIGGQPGPSATTEFNNLNLTNKARIGLDRQSSQDHGNQEDRETPPSAQQTKNPEFTTTNNEPKKKKSPKPLVQSDVKVNQSTTPSGSLSSRLATSHTREKEIPLREKLLKLKVENNFEDLREAQLSFSDNLDPTTGLKERSKIHPGTRSGTLESNTKFYSAKPAESTGSETSILSDKGNIAEKEKRWGLSRPDPETYSKSILKKSYSLFYKASVVSKSITKKLFGPTEASSSRSGRCIEIDASRDTVLVDQRTGKEYIGNTITSSRYSVWNFVPRQLYFQFSKLANAYFLLVSILQLIPGLSTTGTYTTIVPLIFFVMISIGKEGYDDFRRHKLDQVENSRETFVLRDVHPVTESTNEIPHWSMKNLLLSWVKMPSIEMTSDSSKVDNVGEGWKTIKWENIRVGDIVKLQRNDHVPADIVLLQVDGQNNIAYIETMALDGETNLKSKQAPQALINPLKSLNEIVGCRDQVVVEDPNTDLYNFDGRITINGETLPLTINEVVFRGSTLRNTKSVIGMVINTGEDCKIRMNANKNPRIKAPELQKITNRIVLLLVLFVVSLALSCTILYQTWSAATEQNAFYLKGAHVNIAQIFFGFFILYNTLIPLSLYCGEHQVKYTQVGQMLLMNDVEMYDQVSNTPMVVNTTTILENLGQINYIFSDKTGTLTDNVMRFRKLSVAGYAWLHDFDLQKESGLLEHTQEVAPTIGKIGNLFNSKKTPAPGVRIQKSMDNIPRRSDSLWKSTARPLKHLNAIEYGTEELLKYMQYKPHSNFTKRARFFLLSLALCHTCLPETLENGKVEFQAASPDELALVQASQDLGWLVIDRGARSITLSYPEESGSTEPRTELYEILDVIEFSSKRKRMSIIVRFPDGKVCIFCKGADSVIAPRLRNASLANQKKSDVLRRSSFRKSIEAEHALKILSPRTSFSQTSITLSRQRSTGQKRSSLASPSLQPIRDELDLWLRQREHSDIEIALKNTDTNGHASPRTSNQKQSFEQLSCVDQNYLEDLVDDAICVDDVAIFERCFQHIDDFASEGLRTLLFGYKFLDDEEYNHWKKIYADATTSLEDRQELIEKAGDLIEQDFDLSGATAIEDKLQKGVPETIDKLRRANIKIWMLTGDKRETAINIAHSARICKSYSQIIILDHSKEDIKNKLSSSLLNLKEKTSAHTVIVVDGQTLTEIDGDNALADCFFDLVILAESVICCRASPSQKSSLVKRVRTKVAKSTTLAIGDGANDIAMILEAHVGIGISGKEGLQAARISDYSIAQFRFLQKLLLVHGRWNYVRTSKYILATFWKELVFYMLQAMYQKWVGYTGTSLFESTSLTVFNTLFTSLAVIIIGIFEQDLSATTLLAVPELYVQGQLDEAFNVKKYLAWMAMAISESTIVFFMMFSFFGVATLTQDNNLLAMGTLCFTVSLILINTKLLIFEMHHKTFLTLASWTLTVVGWFLWQILLSDVFHPGKTYPLYPIKDGFLHHFGAHSLWWLVLILSLACLFVLELGVSAIRKTFRPTDTDVFQELQSDALIRKRFEDTLAAESSGTSAPVEMGRENNADRSESDIQALLNHSMLVPRDMDAPRIQKKTEFGGTAMASLLINRALSKGRSRADEIEMAERKGTARNSAEVKHI
ncbi:putative phospholipid-transporting ATPase [Podosphaera aphanis]|nr:putative phospholipid-transporting ATPase [Podosphaera aphanis]